MTSSKLASEWAVANPAIARGRLLTSARYLTTAGSLVDRMVGYVDAVSNITGSEGPLMRAEMSPAATEYLALGMDECQRELLHAVHALDLGDPEPQPSTPFRPIHPATEYSRTATELARDILAQEIDRLRAGGGGWGGGSPEAMRLVAAMEVLMDSTIAGRRPK